jgi:hypothetical protein
LLTALTARPRKAHLVNDFSVLAPKVTSQHGTYHYRILRSKKYLIKVEDACFLVLLRNIESRPFSRLNTGVHHRQE